MADAKNEPGKTSPSEKQAGGAGTGGKISAGTSVGNIGETPMPHAQDEMRDAQSSAAPASETSMPPGGGTDMAKNQSSRQSVKDQGGSMKDKARQPADQMRQRAGEAYEDAAEWVQDTYEHASDWASDTYERQRRRMKRMGKRSTRSFGQVRGNVQHYISQNPMVVGLVGLAAGLLLGALLPRTRRENEMFGEWADEVRNQGLRYARDAAKKGREYVEETFVGDDTRFGGHESEFEATRPDTNRH